MQLTLGPVKIRGGPEPVWSCKGPDSRGDCPRARPGEVVPCAGCEVHLSSAPDDLWVFTAPATSQSCPLGWLVKPVV